MDCAQGLPDSASRTDGRTRLQAESAAVEVAVLAIWSPRAGGPHVLVTRRRQGTHLAGFWELPGGKIEAGEAPAEAAARELDEELGLSVGSLDQLAVVDHDYGDVRVRLHAFIAVDPLVDEADAATASGGRWVPVADLPAMRLPKANEPISASIMAWFDDRRPCA